MAGSRKGRGLSKFSRRFLIALAAGVLIGLDSFYAPQGGPRLQAQVAVQKQMQGAPVGGLIYSALPARASQLEYGWEAYRLVCAACHAYNGQGLTSDWILTWAPQHQNCWQSKCHSASHPPDGFVLPTYVPPIIGEGILVKFGTAEGLYDYISRTMPYQDPGYMTAEEYWNVTAFLIRANGYEVPAPLDANKAATLSLERSK